ncbi:cytochrome c oxidase assembly protein subunit 15 [Aquabacterium commune]|uniref:Cytochrome c oxidase assembly protein subunit 15 n=1 Tax=Aquabacterium commune TaxID=70586 RepID=A0A4R6RJE6_9BURK|nr:COX15/CtaA family protein [Aquabacterium commune]TDP85756.1 cytochrome c oxidase assembly protein subunit 15 [Aquabacterium commune]
MLALINLNPAVEVALLGAALAVLPAAWVLRRGRQQGLQGWPAWQRVLTVATLFLTLDLVVFGAFTRLTDSGLGCPDWPGCYGELSPFQAHSDISAAQAALPGGPVTHGKAWIEMLHRYLATGVGALITALMLLAWRMRHAGGLSPWWATATFVWVCAQGAFGALTVTLKLQPIIVTGHLLGAVLGVAMLTAQVRVLSPRLCMPGDAADTLDAAWAGAGLRRVGLAVLLLLVVQIASGAWVSTNYAVLACSEFPTCQGQWWPDTDFRAGFHLLRPLGGDSEAGYLTLAGLTAIHLAHRCLALVVALALATYAWRLGRWQVGGDLGGVRPWRREARVLVGLLLWQLTSGLSNVVLGWPLVAALAHTLGAALLVAWLVRLWVLPRGAIGHLAQAEAEVPQRQNPTARHQGHHPGDAHPAAS